MYFYRLYNFNHIVFSTMNVANEFILAEANIMQCSKTPPVKAFRNDLFLKSKNVVELQILLERVSCVLKSARISLKASKSKTFVLTKQEG